MFRKRKLLSLILITFSIVIFLPGIWTYAQGGQANITHIKLTDVDSAGYLESDLQGNKLVDPVYNDGSTTNSMTQATVFYICPHEPTSINEDDPTNPYPEASECQKVEQATLGAAWNTYVYFLGTWWYFAP